MTSIYEQFSLERKQGQAEGTVPSFYTTASYQMFKNKYTYGNQTIRERYEDIAKAAGEYATELYGEANWAERFFDVMWKGWLSPSTPILANLGTDRGMAVSCSGGVVDDSIFGFYDSRLETAVLTKHGFGTSAYVGGIRPRGASFSDNGKANGPLPVMKGFVQDMRDTAQGSVRRGAWAGYIDIEHDDYNEVIDYVFNNPDDFNLGVNIGNDFVEQLKTGDRDSISRYQKLLRLRAITGKGYMCFIDKANAQNPECYKELGLSVKASNLCVAADTMIMTSEGPRKIKDLKGTPVNVVVDGSEYLAPYGSWSNGFKETVRLQGKYGMNLEATRDHKILDGQGNWVEVGDLKSGDVVRTYRKPFVMEVVSVEDAGFQEVFDMTVEDVHRFDANGFVAHNCSEIFLHADSENSFTCVLSSLNLAKYDVWRHTDLVFVATVFLDCIAEDLIRRGSKIKGMERVVAFTKKSRALGLGVMGYHTYLQSKMIPFADASELNESIFKSIEAQARVASEFMYEKAGAPEWCGSTKRRNTHLMAIAPTMSTALIMGGVSQGIEPIVANVWNQSTAAGEIERINPALLQIMKSRGVYNKETIEDIIDNTGSVQHVDWLDAKEKLVFLTAYELDQFDIVEQASQRQKHIDQGQSLNLFFKADASPQYVSAVHKKAMLDPRIKGLYYMRSLAGVKASRG